MLVGISILVACAAFFAYLQLPGATSHDQVDVPTPSPASAAGAAAASQRSSSFPSLVWAFLCAGIGLSSSGRSRGSGGSGSGSSRGLGPRTAPTVSPASIQLPLLRQGSSFPVPTGSTSLSAAPVPAISNVPQMRFSSPQESPDTTPKARPTKLANENVPSISLSAGEGDDDTPPTFPAINSAQRARTTSSHINSNSVPINRLHGNSSSVLSMPPPPLPLIRGRNPRSQPTVIAPPSATRLTPAAVARGPTSQRSPFLPGTAGGTAQVANGGIPSIGSGGLMVPPTHNTPPTKPNKKVILGPGHSPLDWARLCRTAPPEVLRGPRVPPGLLRVTPSMLAKYGRPKKPRNREKGSDVLEDVEKQDMVWMALEGKVYNITAYMPFHPGGEGELLRAAGKDGTSLFMKTHNWVNVEGMLGGCLVGILVSEEEGLEVGVKVGPGLEDVD